MISLFAINQLDTVLYELIGLHGMQEVGGSIPPGSTITPFIFRTNPTGPAPLWGTDHGPDRSARSAAIRFYTDNR